MVAGTLGDQVGDGDAVDDVQRIEHVALALGHLLALAVADQAGEVDVLERDLPDQVVGGHDHARHPEEDDVETGDQHRRRQVAVEATLGHGLLVSSTSLSWFSTTSLPRLCFARTSSSLRPT
ncbi:hypothetical protein G6F40_015641 [Rhizopus arrhizus]|nr:hypothetical protein G6F40_015641 [Rhizopus arrhizus]